MNFFLPIYFEGNVRNEKMDEKFFTKFKLDPSEPRVLYKYLAKKKLCVKIVYLEVILSIIAREAEVPYVDDATRRDVHADDNGGVFSVVVVSKQKLVFRPGING